MLVWSAAFQAALWRKGILPLPISFANNSSITRSERYMRFGKWFGWSLLSFILVMSFSGIYLCEGSLRLSRRPLNHRFQAEDFAVQYQATLESAEILSEDSLKLRAWYFRSKYSADRDVILVHGQGDNRIGMIPYAKLFLSQNYDVLMPDMRNHGVSEGTISTYGLKEAQDIHLWVDWLLRNSRARCVFGLGESMGASILLQSLTIEKHFCAIVAECPYSSFTEIGYDRVTQPLGIDSAFARILFAPAIESALTYARVRYEVDFELVNPAKAVAGSHTPVLLIHGLKDRNILPRHSKRILHAAPGSVQLWEVPGAGHTGAISQSPTEFAKRVFAWFENHYQN